ncbi:MAG TPA: VOC family protein [Candidatus Binatus sp.]|nr:VOC family protein [Candidatus Binatus sp.]
MTTETPEGCGCPPTAPAEPVTGGVHHVILTVNNLLRSRPFYAALMPRLGYPGVSDYGATVGWFGAGGSFWIKQADPHQAGATFSKDRVGLCEVAFGAESRQQVDALARDVVGFGGKLLDPPQEYPEYVPGYYAVFFTDPDGIKLELVHIPG